MQPAGDVSDNGRFDVYGVHLHSLAVERRSVHNDAFQSDNGGINVVRGFDLLANCAASRTLVHRLVLGANGTETVGSEANLRVK